VRSFEDPEPLAARLKHLRHERQALQSARLVERPQDFFLAPDLNPVSCPQLTHVVTSTPQRSNQLLNLVCSGRWGGLTPHRFEKVEIEVPSHYKHHQ
jgi:hypothetical protein